MKVCLVFPCIRNFGFDSLGYHPESVFVNHGLASLSAVAKQEGHEVRMVDFRELHHWGEVYQKLQEYNADVYGVYMSTLDFHEAKTCATFIKSLNKKCVVGGPHPSICPEHVMEKTVFDHVFVGEGEKTFPEFVEDPSKFERLIVGERPDLNALPYEDREIFNMKKILASRHPYFPSTFISVISGRGCPYNCSFCKPGEAKIFGKFRMRSIEHFMGEIEMLVERYDFPILMIDDDSFTVKPSYVKDFCDAYEKIKRPFVCQTRADFIVNNSDLVKQMKQAGLYMFIIGFEHGNQRILNLLRKGTTVEQNVEAAEICHRNDIKVWANIMFGMPTETREEVNDTVEMVRKIKPHAFSPSFFSPIVGTDMYDYCKKEGLLLSDDPAHVGMRSPTEPKIRGVDYSFLSSIIYSLSK